MALKIGNVNNCENCGASYGQYDDNPNSNWSEYWFQISVPGKDLKGLCQFCNPKSKYYNKDRN